MGSPKVSLPTLMTLLPALCLVGRVLRLTDNVFNRRKSCKFKPVYLNLYNHFMYIHWLFCIIYNLKAILWYLKLWFLANSARNSLEKYKSSMIIICFIIDSFCQSSGVVLCLFFYNFLTIFFHLISHIFHTALCNS